ncbi:hypothetical protein [Exiguobacterium sp. SH0S2]|uniref:hypothetical protein n=1 Tax=Exiguobacterium sp. SH0S2 TaxID=2510950 RepID=UPI00103FDC7D|nr:hypothetical protein [Exiguobacterium sp. SH0S2]TCI58558.1 hypothetical protein EVJ21_15090 [Exiguobacterium sp. SH0S2]
MAVVLHLSNGTQRPVPASFKKSSEVLELMKQFGPDGHLILEDKEGAEDIIFNRHIVMIEEVQGI